MTSATITHSGLRLRTPEDILAGVPYLFGFHPSDSLIVLGMRGPWLHFHMRSDLPREDQAEEAAAQHGKVFHEHDVDRVILIGYGPKAQVAPVLFDHGLAMAGYDIEVHDLLWTHDGRYRSLLCESEECCPADGKPLSIAGSEVAATATLNGMVALPDREALVSTLAAPAGAALEAAEAAREEVTTRLNDLLDVPGTKLETFRPAIDEAIERYRAGGRLDDSEIAWLAMLVHNVRLRDEAWSRIDADGPAGYPVHDALWTDVVRRCAPLIVTPAAMLLAFVNWRAGGGVRARIALDRALETNPGYRGAQLVAELLNQAVSPHSLPPVRWQSPEPPRRPRRVVHRRRR